MDSRYFFYELGKLVYKIDGAYSEYAKKEKISSPNLLWILYALGDGEEHTQKQICDEWEIPRSTANTIIKSLEDDGFIELAHRVGTRREMTIRLTDRGKAYSDEILNDLYDRERKVFDQLKNPERFLKEMECFTRKLSLLYQDSQANS
ncbi:MAG: MarR family winged helix-turn-helix transcriptional regulator [Eubacteriales bacterium]|nr:MarR family winged helix-turn-helix transcriptional regulator [Eubacteriales bacterium]